MGLGVGLGLGLEQFGVRVRVVRELNSGPADSQPYQEGVEGYRRLPAVPQSPPHAAARRPVGVMRRVSFAIVLLFELGLQTG